LAAALAVSRKVCGGSVVTPRAAMIGAIVETGDAAPQQRLLGVIDAVARERGCGDVIASWGGKYEWMRNFRPDRRREGGRAARWLPMLAAVSGMLRGAGWRVREEERPCAPRTSILRR
jgi:hypothetical protein